MATTAHTPPAAKISKGILSNISNMTNENYHTGAIIELVASVNREDNNADLRSQARRILKALNAISILHKHFGHMPHDLVKVRCDLRQESIDLALATFKDSNIDEINECF